MGGDWFDRDCRPIEAVCTRIPYRAVLRCLHPRDRFNGLVGTGPPQTLGNLDRRDFPHLLTDALHRLQCWRRGELLHNLSVLFRKTPHAGAGWPPRRLTVLMAYLVRIDTQKCAFGDRPATNQKCRRVLKLLTINRAVTYNN